MSVRPGLLSVWRFRQKVRRRRHCSTRTLFSAEGNVLQIWDVYFNSVVAPQAYIEGTNVVSKGTSAVWPFKEGDAVKHYYWTKT